MARSVRSVALVPATALFLVLHLTLPGRAAAIERIVVVASLPPLAGIAERVGGDRVTVETLLPPGASEESYSPSPRQVARLEAARIVVRIAHPALLLEQRVLGPFLATHPQVAVVDLAAGAELLPAGDAPAGASDPHLWLSPSILGAAAERLASVLATVDPAGAAVYAANRAALERELAALTRELQGTLAALPARTFLAYHPSYGYFAHAFGLRQLAVEAEGKEPGLADLVRLAERARQERVTVILTPPGPLERGAHAVAETVGARVEVVDPLGRDPLATLRQLGRALLPVAR